MSYQTENGIRWTTRPAVTPRRTLLTHAPAPRELSDVQAARQPTTPTEGTTDDR